MFFGCDGSNPAAAIDYCNEIDGEWVGLIRNVTFTGATGACPEGEDVINEDISYVSLIISQENQTVQRWENGEIVQTTDFSCNDNQLETIEDAPNDDAIGPIEVTNMTVSIANSILTINSTIQFGNCVMQDISTYQEIMNID